MSIYTVTVTDFVTPCTARLPRHQDVIAATQPRPETDPAAGADALAVRCDRLGESRAQWATYYGEALVVIDSLRSVAIDRAGRLAEARAEVDRQRLAREANRVSLSRANAWADEARAEVRARDAEIRRLREALAAPDEAKAEKAAKRRQERIAAACRAVQGEDDITPQIRTALRRLVGVSATSVPVVLVTKGAPRLTGEAGYYTTPAGAICQYPNAYRSAHRRPIHHPSTETVEVSAAWVRSHAPTIAKAAVG